VISGKTLITNQAPTPVAPRGAEECAQVDHARGRGQLAAPVDLLLDRHPVFKKIQLVGTSPNSFDEATANAVAKANETLRNISWFEVVELRGSVVEEEIHQYQVTVSIGFRVE